MVDKHSSKSRRKLLKSIAAGSGTIVAGKNLPESWSRPMVDSVILPAHARTSTQNTPCTQCGEQLLTDGIGGLPLWDSLSVAYNSNLNSYRFAAFPSYMFQVVVLSENCIGSTLRLNFGDAGGDGPLTVSIAIGNTVQQVTYTGVGDLTLDMLVPPGPTSPVVVRIESAGTSFDLQTTILSPTLTVTC